MINIMAWDLTSKVYTILMLKAVKLVRFTGIIIIIHGMHAGAVYMFILFSITQVSSLKYSGYQIGYFVWGESHYWWSYTLSQECAYYVYTIGSPIHYRKNVHTTYIQLAVLYIIARMCILRIYNCQSYTLLQECAYCMSNILSLLTTEYI